MGKTLEYDIFDAMVERLLCPLTPLGKPRRYGPKPEGGKIRLGKPATKRRPR